MSFFDGVIALAIIGMVFWVVLAKMARKNPGVKEWMENLPPISEKISADIPKENTQQIYSEKRSMI